MDAEAEELGGRRKFFSGDYARYGWARLMRSALGAHETALDFIRNNRIHCLNLSAQDHGEVVALMEEVGQGPDLADFSVPWLAEKLDCILLTGDAPLRHAANQRLVQVHGTLWIFDTLLEYALLTRLSLFDFFEGQNRVFWRRNSNRFSRGTPEKWPVVPTPPLDGG